MYICSMGWNSVGSAVPFPTDFKAWGKRKKSNPPSDEDLIVAGKKYVQDFFIEVIGGEDPIPDEHILIVTTMTFPDPTSVSGRHGHIGMNVELLTGMFAVGTSGDSHRMNLILIDVAHFLLNNTEAKTTLYIVFVCRSGRHRSVLCANVLRYILSDDEEGKFCFVNWTHFCEFYWRAVKCQKRGYDMCDQCREGSYLASPAALDIIKRVGSVFRASLVLMNSEEHWFSPTSE